MSPGDKVLCIDASINSNDTELVACVSRCFPNWVKQDATYTIREISDLADIGAIGILLEEIHNPLIPEGRVLKKWIEPRFAMFRFRKLETTSLEEEVDEEKLVKVYI